MQGFRERFSDAVSNSPIYCNDIWKLSRDAGLADETLYSIIHHQDLDRSSIGPDLFTIARVAALLDVSMDYLIDNEFENILQKIILTQAPVIFWQVLIAKCWRARRHCQQTSFYAHIKNAMVKWQDLRSSCPIAINIKYPSQMRITLSSKASVNRASLQLRWEAPKFPYYKMHSINSGIAILKKIG